ncbi:MAG TPA: hypothetical protein VLA93_21910 [Pyrinomonadaceae bacterium]|nr:hypothetical protein [Pyrinomonadaceae bacterium]
MPKDNENILLPLDGPTTPSQPLSYAAEEMIRCDACLRANPPTRAECFYCGVTLPATESSERFRRPALLTPDKSAPGYNTILIAHDQTRYSPQEAAQLLKLSMVALEKLLATTHPMPIARTAAVEESELLADRLRDLGLQTETISDERLGVSARHVIRLRSIVFDDKTLSARAPGRGEPLQLDYSDLLLMVQGRLFTKTTAIKERKSRGSENEILEASEFYSDESIVDLYCSSREQTFRIAANSFDFSCLGQQKALIVNQNITTLVQLLKEKEPHMAIDSSYGGARQLLDLVWGAEKQTKSDGWRRDSPGRLTVGATTTITNENQFTRYSRLSYTFLRQK